MADAELARFVDRHTMEYVHTYPHPIERVWRAIIEPEEFGVWFIKGRLDPRVGGRFWFGDDGFQGAVAAIEPPRLLRLADDKNDTFQYELTEVPGGTRMSFIHHIPPSGPYEERPDPSLDGETEWDLGGDLPGGLDTPWRPGFTGGFHDMHDKLAEFLDGVPVGSRLPPTEFSAFVRKWALVPGNDVPEEQKRQRMLVYRGLRSRERWFELIRLYRTHIAATIPPPRPTKDA
ncbi:MAG TPA: SRPBCC domain-containing protein [Caulobacteraceae bacterium]|jgi:uncharacterized protein YndB with AHSA1/START domain|nr:SRPBCC domain-containing protein [Caulobacteraceae bacterium]